MLGTGLPMRQFCFQHRNWSLPASPFSRIPCADSESSPSFPSPCRRNPGRVKLKGRLGWLILKPFVQSPRELACLCDSEFLSVGLGVGDALLYSYITLLYCYLCISISPGTGENRALIWAEPCGQDHGSLPEFNAGQGIRGWTLGTLCLSRLHGPLLSGSG